MTRILLGAALATALAIGFPGAAGAQTHIHTDPAGDVWSQQFQSGVPATRDPASTDSDVRQVVVQHRKRVVFVSMTTRTIDAQGRPGTDQVHVEFISRGHRRMVVDLTERNSMIVRRAKKNGTLDYWYRCRAIRSTTDLASGRRTVTLPRKCIGNPKRLRVVAWALSTDVERETLYTDDAYGPSAIDGYQRPCSSPWLKRG